MNILRLAPVLCAAALVLPAAQAQPVYRITGPDGKVTFTDRAPGSGTPPPAQIGGSAEVRASAADELPYALRQVAARYPVTLYSGSDCTPCTSARALLMQRGVPFTERTVNTAEDVDALKRLAGEASLPLATLGAQQLKGYSEAEWTQYLDAAGYPRQPQLPASYRRPAPAPLAPVVARPATPAAASAPAERPRAGRPDAAAPPAPARNPANPAGIIF